MPFSVQVAQPGGLFDGWFLRTSGAGIVFTSESDKSTRFAVEGSGHLCAVGKNGSQGNAAIAIINTLDTIGGPLWMVDANVTVGVEPRGYGDLICQGAGNGLACANGTVKNWVGCGLQLELTSLTGGTVEMDGRNCSALSLSVIGAIGNGTIGGNGTQPGNGTVGGGGGDGSASGTAVLPTGAETEAPATEGAPGPSSGAETGPGLGAAGGQQRVPAETGISETRGAAVPSASS